MFSSSICVTDVSVYEGHSISDESCRIRV